MASKFAELMGQSPFHYADALYQKYLVNHNNDTFRDATIIIARFQKWIRHYQDRVLQVNGVGKELARCEEIGESVSAVLNALEDMLCHGMACFDDIVKSHSRRELMYQSLPSRPIG